MTEKTFVARWNGEVVGTRRSHRDYLFAIIGHQDEVAASAYAYAYTATALDRQNFDYATERAGYTPGVARTIHVTHTPRAWSYEQTLTAEQVAEERARIEGGFEGFVARQKAREIASFEDRKAAGAYTPHVLAWSMSERAARNALSTYAKRHVVLGLAPAEVVEPAPRKAKA